MTNCDDDRRVRLAKSDWYKIIGALVTAGIGQIVALSIFLATLWSDNRIQDVNIQNNSNSIDRLEKSQLRIITEIKQDIRDIKTEIKGNPK